MIKEILTIDKTQLFKPEKKKTIIEKIAIALGHGRK
jgi:hypothetical protein